MRGVRSVRVAVLVGLVAALTLSCAQRRPPPSPPPRASTLAPAPENPVQLERAVTAALAEVVGQLKNPGGILDKLRPGAAVRGVIVDRFVDSSTGQATRSTRALDALVLNTLKILHPDLDAVAATSTNLQSGRIVLAGTVGPEPAPQGDARRWRVHISATDIATRIVAGKSSVWIEEKEFDTTPIPANADAPVYLRDKTLDGQIETAKRVPGTTATAAYMDGLSRSVVASEAEDLYELKRYEESLSKFLAAAALRPEPSPRVHSGSYVTNVRLNRPADAERDYEALVKLGLDGGSFATRFLFGVNSTDFVRDAAKRAEYAIWIRQISRNLAARNACATLIGHASRTGAESYNERLSLQRAEEVRRQLIRAESGLTTRTSAEGRGFRETVVGSGTDDERDQLDRRVEIRARAC